MMQPKAFVLLSGGIDSTVCLHQAVIDYTGKVEAISVSYGQRHIKEIVCAQRTCHELGIPNRVIDLSGIVPRTVLTDKSTYIPAKSYAEIEGVSPVYVPFRNGLMLSAVASVVHGEYVRVKAEWLAGCSTTESAWANEEAPEWAIYFGAHAEDARNWAYPDCTPEFTGALANAIYVGTYRAIRLVTPLQWLTKSEIVRKGQNLGVKWESTWSCYTGAEAHCGICPSCRSRRHAFFVARVPDLTGYAHSPKENVS